MKKRLSNEERRESIVKAALPLFVKEGFARTTTKKLALAAGVSEALLYKHFPSKSDLYSSIQHYCFANVSDDFNTWVGSFPNNTETLVKLVKFFMKETLSTKNSDKDLSFSRLMFHSLMEDGEFAHIFIEARCTTWRKKMKLCIEAAIIAGDMKLDDYPIDICSWFVHHLHVGIILLNLPQKRVVHYELSHEEMADKAVKFCLRGLGLKEKFIK